MKKASTLGRVVELSTLEEILPWGEPALVTILFQIRTRG